LCFLSGFCGFVAQKELKELNWCWRIVE